MHWLPEQTITCPYCGEFITVLVDDNDESQYVEDCQVCCRPIVFEPVCEQGEKRLWARRDDE